MEPRFEAIPVRDGNGNRLIVYKVLERSAFGWPERRWQLFSGETVERISDSTFIVAATGEPLTRA